MLLHDQQMTRTTLNFAKTAAILYTVKRWNIIPLKYNKFAYIFLLSPLILIKSLTRNDVISGKYRKFLISLCYPESKSKFHNTDVFKHCEQFHDRISCRFAFFTESRKTVNRIFQIYFRLYILQFIFKIIILWKRKLLCKQTFQETFKKSFESFLKSTLFLAGQNILQRFFLCLLSKHTRFSDTIQDNNKKEKLLYLTSLLGSIPILAERTSRVQQINSLIIAHLLVGTLRKSNTAFPMELLMFLSTFFVERRIYPVTLLISNVTALTF